MKRTHVHHMVAVALGLMVVGLGLGAAVAQPVAITMPTTEGWQQLVNSRYGYALQYPQRSTAKLYEPEGILHIIIGDGAYPFVIWIHENPNELTARDWVTWRLAENRKMIGVEPSVCVLDAEEVKVGDQSGYTLFTSAADHQNQSVFLAHGSKVYEIGFATAANPNDPRSAERYQVFLQMLDTLFLRKTPGALLMHPPEFCTKSVQIKGCQQIVET
jgi:hypothetical protein